MAGIGPAPVFSRSLPPMNRMEGKAIPDMKGLESGLYRKTRIAPTPSGFLHLGNVLSFALTAILAERYGARILLRIDDLDRQRVRPEYILDIFDTLSFLGIPWQEGPRNAGQFAAEYAQLQRMPLYHLALQQLRNGGYLFACNCSRSDILKTGGIYTGTCCDKHLDWDTPGVSWRMDTRRSLPLTLHQFGAAQEVSLPGEQQFFVVRKKDGDPAYQLASVIDDLHFGVDLIVRGNDLYPSTLAQLYLARMLGNDTFGHVLFYHHPLLTLPDGVKLSKSAGATSVQYLRRQGMSRSEIFTLIGDQLGIRGVVSHWQDLASLLPV